MVVINPPNTDSAIQQIKYCIGLFKDLEREAMAGLVSIDLRNCIWLLPCAALVLSHKISQFHKGNVKIEYTPPSNSAVASYLSSIGFYDSFDRVDSRPTSLPIRHFTEGVQVFSSDLVDFSSERISGGKNYLGWLIGEICDNIEQHSNFNHASIMAQHFPNKKMVDLTFVDNGVGFKKSLEDAGYNIGEDVTAIQNAIEGLSSKVDEKRRGHGLPSTRKIVEEGLRGELTIVSGRGALVTSHTSEGNVYILKNTDMPGVLVNIRFDCPEREVNVYEYFTS